MKVLFIGGTGLISTAVSKLAIIKGFDLWIMNRGMSTDDLPLNVNRVICDINDENAVKMFLNQHRFDAIVDWIAFTLEHVQRDYHLFKGYTNQYVFISSASAYIKPITKLPITEKEVVLDNRFWTYSKNKQLCEEYLLGLNDPEFNVTVIRPTYTYDEKSVVAQLNSWEHPYTLIHRMKMNKSVVILDDGKALWTLTYNGDFAHGFLDVLGNPKTYGEAYHLTSDLAYTWLEIHQMLEKALNIKVETIKIPTEEVIKHFTEMEGNLLGDKAHSLVFDNSKIKAVAPNYKSETGYEEIIIKTVKWYEEHQEFQIIDEEFDQNYDELVKRYKEKSINN